MAAFKPRSSIFYLQRIYTTMATIALLGMMDTKGTEYAFLAEQIQKRGHHTLLIDTGILGEPGTRRFRMSSSRTCGPTFHWWNWTTLSTICRLTKPIRANC